MKSRSWVLAAFFAVSFSQNSYAAVNSENIDVNPYFEIVEVEVREDASPDLQTFGLNGLGTPPALEIDAPSIANSLTDVFKNMGDVNAWISLGAKIWQVVKDNQPVVNVTTQTTSVLPKNFTDWTGMETWQGPFTKSYTISAKNLYGMTVISQSYTVVFNYGGSFGGRGAFIANATIIPTRVDVSWGFKLNSEVEVGQALNTGTKLDPVPGVPLTLKWSMESMLKKIEGRDQFFIKGDGSVTHVTL